MSATASTSGCEPFDLDNLKADDGFGDTDELTVESIDFNPATALNEGYTTSSGTHSVLIPFTSSTQAGQLVALPPVSMSENGGDDDYAHYNEISLNISLVAPEKSIMITGPGNVYTNGQWNGMGDTLFSNDEYQPIGGHITVVESAGTNYGSLNWAAGLLGDPWPVFADYQAGWFTRNWDWAGDGGVLDSGDTFDVHALSTARPHVDWPWDGDVEPEPRDFLEQCSNGPPIQQKHILLHLTDVDQLGTYPEWNFDHTANYYLTFHNECESPSDQVSVPTPLSDNPWKEFIGPGNQALSQVGIAPDNDSQGQPVQGTGTYPWSPGSQSAYVEYNYGGSLDCTITDVIGVGVNGGVNNGQQVSQNVPSKVIPVGYRGTVYYRNPTNRISFHFRHYLVGGEDIRYDADGNLIPWNGQVDEPVGGVGTNSVDFAVWVELDGYDFPATTTANLAGGG